MKRNYRACCLVLFFSFWVIPGKTLDLTGPEILRRVDSVYAHADSYRDKGLVRTEFTRKRIWPRVVKKKFNTLFVRDKLLRFEYSTNIDLFPYYGFQWDSSRQVFNRSFFKQGKRQNVDVGLPVAGATGVSSGAAHTVPRLLLPGHVGGRHLFSEPDSFALMGLEEIEGVTCYKIGNSKGTTIWIDPGTYLIRRIFETLTTAPITTTYYPEINTGIRDSDLPYRPRAAAFKASINNIQGVLTSNFQIQILVVILLSAYLLKFFDRRKKRRRKS